ncbi:MAG: ISAs1 family transposase [Planctomycetota bacterium]
MKTETWQGYADGAVLARVTVRLIRPKERRRWDQLMRERHYLKSAAMVGCQMRYVAELDGEWIALLGWCAPAYHLKFREAWVGWSIEQRLKRRKFMVQNSRYLLLVDRGQYPNLASRVLSLCCRQLPEDWENQYGYRVLAAESFVDPERFRGSCYLAAGWEKLGKTQGYRRCQRDFYEDDSHPKELWVRALHPEGLKWLRAEHMPERFRLYEDPAEHCPYKATVFRSLWNYFLKVTDPRSKIGRRHRLASVLAICTVATLCGARGPRAIADFAQHLNKTQRRLLGCYKRRGEHEVPSESTIRRVLQGVPAEEFDEKVIAWMKANDTLPLKQLAVDGKTIKQAKAADGRAVHLVAAVSTESGRLCAQRPVADHSNEITALEPMLASMPLDGVIVSADAMQAQQKAARFLVHEKGADYFFSLKGNQPSIEAAAERLLAGAFPPWSGTAGTDYRETAR